MTPNTVILNPKSLTYIALNMTPEIDYYRVGEVTNIYLVGIIRTALRQARKRSQKIATTARLVNRRGLKVPVK